MQNIRTRILPVVALIALSGVACWAEADPVSLPKIKQSVEQEKGVLVDVREQREWDQGHVQGAIFLPLSKLKNGLSESDVQALPKDKILYTHCVVGKRAVTAANVLKKHGYQVQPIKPGYKQLIEAGFSKAK
ncbi:MAG: rhodanese-like domain-containing protein [Blastopirellula sp. JB062]